ncbi:hypothetical protein ACFYV5_20020 [Streptomyces sp. NPDC003035]|uniref:hypothetical protein n=1 Tax=unclassified Streptomyces TaxID=2593676 RepID=UPI0033AB698D
MSIISSLPILQGRDGVVLCAVSGGLILERPREVVTIPGEAVARVRAEGRSVAVELRAPAGATPAVHRIEDVSEDAAAAFAEGVNSLLIEPDEEVDAATLVVVRTLRTKAREKALRRLKWFVLSCVGTVVALCVICAVVGSGGHIIALVPFGFLAIAALTAGVFEMGVWMRRRRLLKHGVKTFARPADVPGRYLYTDGAGVVRVVSWEGNSAYVAVSYDPDDPADVYAPQNPLLRRFNTVMGSFLLFCGLLGMVMVAIIAVDALTGGLFTGDGS